MPSVTRPVNCSVSEGVVQGGFQRNIPMIKNTSVPLDELKNYSPVSCLSSISELIECVVASWLNVYVNSNALENDSLIGWSLYRNHTAVY